MFPSSGHNYFSPVFTFLLFACFYFFLGFSADLTGQTSGQFATLVSLQHACDTSGVGSVEFELNGDPDLYDYYWLHGPRELALTGLEPGEYTLIVLNTWGCWEEYVIEILTTGGCELEYSVTDPIRPCTKFIELTVFNEDSITLDEASLIIEWSDGAEAGLTRFVPTSVEADYCVTIIVTDSSETCCSLYQCVHIDQDPRCVYNGPPVIVNEYNRNESGDEQYLELLIAGEGECEDSFDLRGYHIDDNNGYLIPASEFVNATNLNKIGINAGFLTFSQASTWESVPNGSLILVYSERGQKHSDIPSDDPTDSNQDGVYILAADNDSLFTAKTGLWDGKDKEMTYEGGLKYPVWELIDLSPYAEGMQVRSPDGTYSHGVSIGISAFAGTNNFPLWLTANSTKAYNCRFTQENPYDKNHFSWTVAVDSLQSPGLANSTENSALINLLQNCPDSLYSAQEAILQPPQNKVGEFQGNDILKLFPNPYRKNFTLNVESKIEGMGKVLIFSLSGQLVFSQNSLCNKGKNIYNIQPKLASGMYFLKFTFPSGHIETLHLVTAQY